MAYWILAVICGTCSGVNLGVGFPQFSSLEACRQYAQTAFVEEAKHDTVTWWCESRQPPAHGVFEGDYPPASQIIPMPTSTPPATTKTINTKCGVDSSTPPEKNWPINIQIAATSILILFGVGFAVIAAIHWLLSLAHRKE